MLTKRLITVLVALFAALAIVPAAAGAATSGTWELFPSGNTTTYQTEVRQPINADGSSNWPAKRGVIPVQFNLLKETGPTVFESIGTGSETASPWLYSFASFTPSPALTWGSLTNLSSVYDFTTGDCYGGSLRWSVRVDVGNNGPADDKFIFIYYGFPPEFGIGGVGGCDANSQSGLNLIDMSDLRYDTSQLGGKFYDSYDNASTLAGNHNITRASLVLDSGWIGDQVVDLTSATVNDNTLTPPTEQPLSRTCDLPPAKIMIAQGVGPPTGKVNGKPQSVQLKDTGEYFRVVDCKYIYNLDVSSLGANRTGTWRIYAQIDGKTIQNPAKFDLR